MKTKWLALGVIVIVACVVGGALMNRHVPIKQTEAPKPVVPVEKAPPAPPIQQEVQPATEPLVPSPEPVKEPAVKPTAPQQTAAQNQKPPKEPLHDPDARDALALVGLDPQAERYWLDAIYDTSLPDNEREDLMEDLNEVGFADPKNLTADDLPLILSRIQMIEQIAPNTDAFMAEHLAEAYKDLWNMYGKVARP